MQIQQTPRLVKHKIAWCQILQKWVHRVPEMHKRFKFYNMKIKEAINKSGEKLDTARTIENGLPVDPGSNMFQDFISKTLSKLDTVHN